MESGSEQLQNVVAKIDSYFGVAGQWPHARWAVRSFESNVTYWVSAIINHWNNQQEVNTSVIFTTNKSDKLSDI